MKIRLPKAKPIRRDDYKRLPITRIPYPEPLTPGLRRKDRELPSAIGFKHIYETYEEEDEGEE